MKRPGHDNRFPPIIRGKISEIYPWSGYIQDHWEFIKYFLRLPVRNRKSGELILRNFFQCPYIYLVHTGRSALMIALQALGVRPGDEVLVAAFNCPAVAEAVAASGGKIKYIDINSHGGLDLDFAARALSVRTKGLLVTHTYGLVDDLDSISAFCRNHNLFLINDLAQTLEDPSANEKLNRYGDISIYSFGPEKHIFGFGGGALVTHSSELARQISDFLPMVSLSTAKLFQTICQRWKYYFTFFILTSARDLRFLLQPLRLINKLESTKASALATESIWPLLMHPVQKAVLIRKLQHYNYYLRKTLENYNLLRNQINLDVITKEHKFPLYLTVRVPANQRFNLSRHLAQKGIATVWNYLPLNTSDSTHDNLPQTETLWQEVLSVPFRYPVSQARISHIAAVINSFDNDEN